jgi:ABC-type nitrate/sulfonate/bicarbonate transport system permease component
MSSTTITGTPEASEDAQRAALEDEFRRSYRAGRRNRVLLRIALNIIGVILFLAFWEAIPTIMPSVNKIMFPPPSTVFAAFWPMVTSGEIPLNILASLRRAGSGFAIAMVLGIAAGVATARLSIAEYLTEPLLHGLRSVPVIALVPLSVLWLGIGEGAKIALVATGAFFPIWIATFIGVRDVHIVYLRSAACLGAERLSTMLWVVLPAALPLILAGLRQAIAVSLIVLVAAELSGATAGVAYMMSMGHQLFRVDIMFIGLLLLGALGFTFDRLFVLLARKLFPWYQTAS